jgi:hypothetical protein
MTCPHDWKPAYTLFGTRRADEMFMTYVGAECALCEEECGAWCEGFIPFTPIVFSLDTSTGKFVSMTATRPSEPTDAAV